MIVVVGALAQPQLGAVLGLDGTPVEVPGVLTGGHRAGVVLDGWPALLPAPGSVPGLAIQPTPQLDRYAAVMGLTVQEVGGMQVMGIGPGPAADHAPIVDRDSIAAEIAVQILQAPEETGADLLAWRLPMMGIWAGSRLRARASAPSGQGNVPQRPADALRVQQRSQPFLGFFGFERQVLTHALHQGGQQTGEDAWDVNGCNGIEGPITDIAEGLDDSIDADSDQRHAILRITREAVSNAVRHGHAGRLCLRLSRDGERRRLTVQDDGDGFDALRSTGVRAGYGLISMRDRARGLPGSLEIDSELGRGSTVTLTW